MLVFEKGLVQLEEKAQFTNYYPLKKKITFNQEIPQLQVCVLRMGPACWLCSLEWALALLSKSSWPGFLHPGKDTMKDLMVTSSAKVSSLFTPSSLCISNSTFFWCVCVGVINHLIIAS